VRRTAPTRWRSSSSKAPPRLTACPSPNEPLLGAAEGILEKVSANAHKRGITYFDFDKQTDSAVVLERVGEAAVRIDSAWLLLERAAYELEELTRTGPLESDRRAWSRVAAGQAADELRIAADSLMSIAGASSFAESSVLQQYWRDLMVGSRQLSLAPASSMRSTDARTARWSPTSPRTSDMPATGRTPISRDALAGRAAVVTGASRGIGRALVLALARGGRRGDRGEAAARRFPCGSMSDEPHHTIRARERSRSDQDGTAADDTDGSSGVATGGAVTVAGAWFSQCPGR
jgi:Acyl-CoA dehydrogenase, C-terminal domain